jgi:hypothetical protein
VKRFTGHRFRFEAVENARAKFSVNDTSLGDLTVCFMID